MNIKTSRLKQIILEELKAVSENDNIADLVHDEEWEQIDLDATRPPEQEVQGIEVVRQKIEELIKAIEDHGSDSELAEDYRDLLYTMQEAGINLRLLMMTVTERLKSNAANEGIVELPKGGNWGGIGTAKGKPSSTLALASELADKLRDNAEWMRVLELVYEELAEPEPEPEEEPRRKIGFEEALQKASLARIIKEEIMSEMGIAFDPADPDDLKKAMVTAKPGDDTYPDDIEVSQARREDLYTVMLKAADELKKGRSQDAYETLLRGLAAHGDGADALYGLPGGAR